MSRPHPALLDLAVERPLRPVDDLDELVRSAREHRMHGLLWTHIDQLVDPSVAAVSVLEAHDATTREWHGRLWQTLDDAVARLRDLGIEVMTLKGVVAESCWYDRIGERPCRDVDLLLAPRDLRRAGEVIDALEPGHPLGAVAVEWISRGILDAATVTVDGVRIDLHFDPLKVGLRCRQAEAVWERARRADLPGGTTVCTLDPELSLILFLLHQTKDRFRYVLGFVDVLRVIDQEDLDWDFVVRFARGEGLLEPVTLALDAVGATLEHPVPKLSQRRGLASKVWNVAWRPSIRLRGSEGRRRYKKRQELLPLLARGRTREGLVHGWGVLFPPRALYEAANPGERGGYAWRLAVKRPLRYIRRSRSNS